MAVPHNKSGIVGYTSIHPPFAFLFYLLLRKSLTEVTILATSLSPKAKPREDASTDVLSRPRIGGLATLPLPVRASRSINAMRLKRSPRIRSVLAGLAVGIALGAVGCSDDSRQSGTLAPVLESDRQALQKSAEARKQRQKETKSRSTQGSRD